MAHIYLNFSTKKPWTQLFFFLYFYILGYFLCSLCLIALQKLGILSFENPSYFSLTLLLLATQGIIFFAPSLFWAHYYSQATWRENVYFKKPNLKKNYLPFWVALCGIPASYFFSELNYAIVVSDLFKGMQTQIMDTEKTVATLLRPLFNDLTWAQYVSTFFLIALLPAFCEELFFRGVLQNIIHRITKKEGTAVVITAFVFALLHAQFLGFLPRFFLGIVLGFLFFQTRTLYAPILFHALFNTIEGIVVFIVGTESLHSSLSTTRRLDTIALSVGAFFLISYIFLTWRILKPKQP